MEPSQEQNLRYLNNMVRTHAELIEQQEKIQDSLTTAVLQDKERVGKNEKNIMEATKKYSEELIVLRKDTTSKLDRLSNEVKVLKSNLTTLSQEKDTIEKRIDSMDEKIKSNNVSKLEKKFDTFTKKYKEDLDYTMKNMEEIKNSVIAIEAKFKDEIQIAKVNKDSVIEIEAKLKDEVYISKASSDQLVKTLSEEMHANFRELTSLLTNLVVNSRNQEANLRNLEATYRNLETRLDRIEGSLVKVDHLFQDKGKVI